MANPYYIYSGAFIPGILARAEAETTEFQAVQLGFAILAVQGTDSGSANAYVITTKGAQNGVYTDGMIVEFKAKNANTGVSTIAVDSGATVALTTFTGQQIGSGAISANTWYRAIYNSTYSAWTLIAPSSLTTTSATVSSGPPVNKVGLTAAGGVLTSVLPSDATWALDQSIAPTWTGAHTFSNTVAFNSTVTFATGLSLTGGSGSYALTLTGSSSAGNSLGELIKAGTNASDYCFRAQNQTGGTDYFKILGEGSGVMGNPTGGGKGVGTINAQNLYVNGVAVLTSSASSANPSATIGLSAVNGTAATFMTSDSAPPLSQGIAPTWTGNHIFNGAGTTITSNPGVNQIGLVINGATNTSSQYLVKFLTGQGSGFSGGLLLNGGTSSSDYTLRVQNASAGADYFDIKGDGSGNLGPTATTGLSWTNNGSWTLSKPSNSSTTLTINSAVNQVGVIMNGATNTSNQYILEVLSGSAAGFSSGLLIEAGTNSSDYALRVMKNGAAADYLDIFGDGSGNLGPTSSVGLSWTSGGVFTLSAPTVSNNTLIVNGAANNYAQNITANSTSGQSFGLFIRGGTTSGDYGLVVSNQANTLNNLVCYGNGETGVGEPSTAAVPNSNGTHQIGYLDVPSKVASSNYQLVMSDRGKFIYVNASNLTITIPANGTVAFPVGTVITIRTAGNTGTQLAITTDNLNWCPSGSTGTRNLAARAVVTLLKTDSNAWDLTGVGIS